MCHHGEKLRLRPVGRGKSRSALLELLLELRVQRAGLPFGPRTRSNVAKNPSQAKEVPMAVVHGSNGTRRFARVRPAMADLQRPFVFVAGRPFSRCDSSEPETECPPFRTTDEARKGRSDQSLVANVKKVHRSDIRLANGAFGIADDICVGRALEELLVVPKRDLETVPVDQRVVLCALRHF